MNWYVLFVLSRKMEHLITVLNSYEEVEAFTPMYEFYLRKTKDYDIKPMFKGYIFIKTEMGQVDFHHFLQRLRSEEEGLIKQLIKEDVSALREKEINMFEKLLDDSYTARMSQAYLVNGRAKVYEGPLKYFEMNIVKVDKHNQLAYLDLAFMDRKIQTGLRITGRNEY